jgi:enamine deaminase RidA (YjgF/YER057c/UK114 family)
MRRPVTRSAYAVNSTTVNKTQYNGAVSVDRINPAGLPRPSGFSHAVKTGGDLVFLAGQTAVGPDGQIAGSGVVEQFERAFGNLLTALSAAGGRPQDLASLTIYIVDVDDYRSHSAEIGTVWRRLAGTGYPAVAAVGVARLWDPGALVEIQGVAAVSR